MMKKLLMATMLMLGVETAVAFPSIRLETAPTENEGSIEADDLGPAFSRPLPTEEPKQTLAPKVEAKNEKNDILSLFQANPGGEKKEVNPLEEEAKNEMRMAAGDPENKTGDSSVMQLGENETQPGVTIQPEHAPKEIDLDTAMEGKNLPGLK